MKKHTILKTTTNQHSKRWWRLLGLCLLGLAAAIYWLDRKTANSFRAQALDLYESGPQPQPDITDTELTQQFSDDNTLAPESSPEDNAPVAEKDDDLKIADGKQTGFVRGDGSRDCPDDFPIKGNASSRIYHRPGESSYSVTVPEMCFATEDEAIAAGYRPRKQP